MDTPYSVEVRREVPSTQDLARDLAVAGTPTLVVSHRQTAGRGRGGSRWANAPRAVAISLGFHSAWPTHRLPLLPLLAGLAARRVMGPSVTLKWPNDVLAGHDKVAGILVEAADGVVVAGMGVNLHWPDPPPGMRGLCEDDPGEMMGPDLARRWADELIALHAAGSDDWGRAEYVAACGTLGSSITWEPDGWGRAVAIGVDGALVVETPTGVISLSAGEVRHVRGA